MILQVIIEHGEDGYFVARCPSLKSCWSQGRTREEALSNIREAIELYLEPAPGDIEPVDGREMVSLSL
jgi:predicted RNase H-like HicB family nuclease